MKQIPDNPRIYANTRMGNELFRVEDEIGTIVVTQRGDKRVLSFGNSMEQSSVYMTKPYYLAHEYTQAMLLGLIFVDAKHVTLLGLGGGSLASCLSHYFETLRINVAELRQIVIDVAYEWFKLPRESRLQVYQADAYQYLVNSPSESTDLIFSDLYDADDMSILQSQALYFESCFTALSANGCLVLNLHTPPEGELSLMQILHTLFSKIHVSNVINGNWIVFCEKNPSPLDKHTLDRQAQTLVEQVRMPLLYYYRQLRCIL